MHDTNSFNARTAALLLGAAIAISILILVLQLPDLSVRRLLHGERVVASGQFWLLEMLAGAITSLIITAITILLFRRLLLWVSGLSVVMQLAWMAFTLRFASPADSIGEFAFRSAEIVGIVAGAALAVLAARGILSAKDTPRP